MAGMGWGADILTIWQFIADESEGQRLFTHINAAI